MDTLIFYFSSTGNSLYVTKKLKEKIKSVEIVSIKKALKEDKLNYESYEKVGIIYPLHCFDIPPIVDDFLSSIKLSKNIYFFAVQVTGGGTSNNGFISINNILCKKNIKLSSIYEIKYISNYIRIGKNPSEVRAKECINKNDKLIKDIAKSIEFNKIKNIPKNKSLLKNSFNKLWKEQFIMKDKNFNVSEECIGCGLCQKICPYQNISMLNSRPKWHGKCKDCMSCINICPKKAINIGKRTVKKNRYKNPYIDSNELF